MKPIAFFIGSRSSFNVRQLLSNLGWMLREQDKIDLITTNPGSYSDNITDRFRIYGDSYPETALGSWKALSAYVREHEPAVVTQLTDPPVHGTLVGLVCHRYGIPFVYRYSGDRFHEWRVAQGIKRAKAFAVGNVLNRLPLYFGDSFLTFGPRGTAQLTTRGVDASQNTVLPPSVDITRFRDVDIPSPIDSPDDRHIVLFVGRVSHIKGARTMEHAIPRILKRRSDMQFVFVGPTTRRIDIPDTCRDHVTMVGAVEPEAMPQYYQQADLLVHPSLTDGIPRVVLEALASRTPVVTRDVGDVATVSENTFTCDQAFVDLVSRFETLELDEIQPFTREALQPRYVDFFGSFR